MKAVRIHEFGDSNVLTLEETPKPQLHDGEVLIKVRAASVNPVDYKIRSGRFKKADIKLPATLGRDVAGVVEAVGGEVVGIKPGDDGYAFLSYQNGGYAEYAVAKQKEVAAQAGGGGLRPRRRRPARGHHRLAGPCSTTAGSRWASGC
ncbi:MAG TPA: alcohol dehydrogenase catalytic domain-containing protein [Opitutaceae bacterium]|nr:alcohol dehydrogenase catalytic domain-containing protein [Opitutaceae bacterium]